MYSNDYAGSTTTRSEPFGYNFVTTMTDIREMILYHYVIPLMLQAQISPREVHWSRLGLFSLFYTSVLKVLDIGAFVHGYYLVSN